MPLVKKYHNHSPFIGVVLAGVYTQGALDQLESLGFNVLYFSYETVVKAFSKFGIDAHFDEATTEEDLKLKIESCQRLENYDGIAKELIKLNKKDVSDFFEALTISISRHIESVTVITLYGKSKITENIQLAIQFLQGHKEDNSESKFVRFEIIVKYNNGDKIEANFKDKIDAIGFLENYK